MQPNDFLFGVMYNVVLPKPIMCLPVHTLKVANTKNLLYTCTLLKSKRFPVLVEKYKSLILKRVIKSKFFGPTFGFVCLQFYKLR